MTLPIVLVVDDKPNMLGLMAKILRSDAQVKTATGGKAALEVLRTEPVDVVLCDLKMPGMDGLDVLRETKRIRPEAEFILMTAYATVDTAVAALRDGAYDYLTKPFDPEHARAVILSAVGRLANARPGTQDEVLPGVLARSPVMLEAAALVRRIAPSELPVVLTGETGTGKERVARAIHQLSLRASERFVSVNCSAMASDSLEAELFGQAGGADRPGILGSAHGGTVYLEEVGVLEPGVQAKLTRVIEQRSAISAGAGVPSPVDVRLILSTHRPLQEMVERGTFREDLWYLLSGATVQIPPLRERREDVELLAFHYLRRYGAGSPSIVGFTHAAMDALLDAPWPGNVRQLKSTVELACVMTKDRRVDVRDLPPALRLVSADDGGESGIDLDWASAQERARARAGREYLTAVLERFGGDVGRAAEHAGVERESYYRLMRRYGVAKGPRGPASG